ncbi:MAG TPA: type II secretion system F family protein [Hyphomicrobiales bacterium]|nr:type II secretion system F family protein [Hyphomicrobiales bacterium]
MNVMSLALCLLLLALGLLLLAKGRRRAASERVLERIERETRHGLVKRRPSNVFERQLLQAGFDVSTPLMCVLLLAALTLLSLVLLVAGAMSALILLLAMLGFGYGLLRWRYQRRVQRMVAQMPALLDHCIRSLKSGRSVPDALLMAIDRSENPLREALSGARRGIELGLSLGDVMTDFAELYDRDEIHMLAVGIKVNQRYGGNASDLFENLIVLIRDRERASIQLSAMTGETRISAWVLGVMPPALGIYIFISSPDFFLGLWNDGTGRLMLYTALALQALGCYSLWRMLRSI